MNKLKLTILIFFFAVVFFPFTANACLDVGQCDDLKIANGKTDTLYCAYGKVYQHKWTSHCDVGFCSWTDAPILNSDCITQGKTCVKGTPPSCQVVGCGSYVDCIPFKPSNYSYCSAGRVHNVVYDETCSLGKCNYPVTDTGADCPTGTTCPTGSYYCQPAGGCAGSNAICENPLREVNNIYNTSECSTGTVGNDSIIRHVYGNVCLPSGNCDWPDTPTVTPCKIGCESCAYDPSDGPYCKRDNSKCCVDADCTADSSVEKCESDGIHIITYKATCNNANGSCKTDGINSDTRKILGNCDMSCQTCDDSSGTATCKPIEGKTCCTSAMCNDTKTKQDNGHSDTYYCALGKIWHHYYDGYCTTNGSCAYTDRNDPITDCNDSCHRCSLDGSTCEDIAGACCNNTDCDSRTNKPVNYLYCGVSSIWQHSYNGNCGPTGTCTWSDTPKQTKKCETYEMCDNSDLTGNVPMCIGAPDCDQPVDCLPKKPLSYFYCSSGGGSVHSVMYDENCDPILKICSYPVNDVVNETCAAGKACDPKTWTCQPIPGSCAGDNSKCTNVPDPTYSCGIAGIYTTTYKGICLVNECSYQVASYLKTTPCRQGCETCTYDQLHNEPHCTAVSSAQCCDDTPSDCNALRPLNKVDSLYCQNGNIWSHHYNSTCSIGTCSWPDTPSLSQACTGGKVCNETTHTCENPPNIKCFGISDCPADVPIGSPFCVNGLADVYQNYTHYYACMYPGETKSYCASSYITLKKEPSCPSGTACVSGVCSDVECGKPEDCGTESVIDGTEACNDGVVTANKLAYSCTDNKCSSYIKENEVIRSCPIACESVHFYCVDCLANTDCGSNYTSLLKCSDNKRDVVYDNHTWVCNKNDDQPFLNNCELKNTVVVEDPCTSWEVCENGACKEVKCNTNTVATDCGASGYIGDVHCLANDPGHTYKTYRTWTCNNPGTTASVCTKTEEEKMQTSCLVGAHCVGGTCQTIECTTNLQCGTDGYNGAVFCDSNKVPWRNYFVYTCTNPGTAQSKCSHTTTPKEQTQCMPVSVCP